MSRNKLSRRDFLKLQAVALGGLTLTGCSQYASAASQNNSSKKPCVNKNAPDQQNSLFDHLETSCINQPLAEDEMRITFLGTSCTPQLTQQGVSVYVEVGPTKPVKDNYGYVFNEPADYAMFDCGMGVLANYIAAGIPYDRMDKIFIAHLHADHMSELSAIYCFGESATRKSPMYVWGPSKSGLADPTLQEQGVTYYHEDGTREILEHFRAFWRWHTESFSFSSNGFVDFKDPTPDWGLPAGVDLTPAGKYSQYKDPVNDAYALIPIELPWEDVGVAYDNKKTGVKITHFPVIHCRKGSLGYKLEFTPPNIPNAKTISMIYSGDTRPNHTMVAQASGIDVLVHEIVMPPDAWTAKFSHVDKAQVAGMPGLAYFTDVQNSSHTVQSAFGYILSQIQPRPRLTVATHFQATDDTIESARQTIDAYCIPREAYTFAADFMVFNVTKDKITQRRLDVSEHGFPWGISPTGIPEDPKYHKHTQDQNGNPVVIGDPQAQLLLDDQIPDGPDTYDKNGYLPGADYSPQCRD